MGHFWKVIAALVVFESLTSLVLARSVLPLWVELVICIVVGTVVVPFVWKYESARERRDAERDDKQAEIARNVEIVIERLPERLRESVRRSIAIGAVGDAGQGQLGKATLTVVNPPRWKRVLYFLRLMRP